MRKFEADAFPKIEHLVDDPAKVEDGPADLRLMDWVINMVEYGHKGVDAHIGSELELNAAIALCRGIWAQNHRPEEATRLFRDISHYVNRKFVAGNLMTRAPSFGQPELVAALDSDAWENVYTKSLISPAGCAEELVRTLILNERMFQLVGDGDNQQRWVDIGCRAWLELQDDVAVIDNAQSRYRPGQIQE